MRNSTVPARVSQSRSPLSWFARRPFVGQWVAVALDQPFSALLAMGGAGQATDLQLHQPLRREANHLAQQISIGVLLTKRAKLHHLVGHWWCLHQDCVGKPT